MNRASIIANCVYVAAGTVLVVILAGGLLTAQSAATETDEIPCAAEVAFLADLAVVEKSFAEGADSLDEDEMAALATMVYETSFAVGERMGRCIARNYVLSQ